MTDEHAKPRLPLWKIAAILAVVVLFGYPVAYDSVRVRFLRNKARELRVGDSKERVRAVLGEPNARFAKGSGLHIFGKPPYPEPERWAYGSEFEWKNCILKEFPYFWPIRLRLFDPGSDDVSVFFDDEGKVTGVRIP